MSSTITSPNPKASPELVRPKNPEGHWTQALSLFRDELPDASIQLYKYIPPTPEPTFHPFSKLPIEIRLNIWELGCAVPHTLHVFRWITKERYKVHHTFIANDRRGERQVSKWCWLWKFHGYRTSTENPRILCTNRESRQVALRIYQPLLKTTPSQGQIAYFNPVADTVCVNFNREEIMRVILRYNYELANHLCPNTAEVLHRLEILNSQWELTLEMVTRNGQVVCERRLFCESLWGPFSHTEIGWNNFRNLKQLSIIRPRSSGIRFTRGIKEMKNQLLKDFQVMQEKDPNVSVPDISLVMT